MGPVRQRGSLGENNASMKKNLRTAETPRMVNPRVPPSVICHFLWDHSQLTSERTFFRAKGGLDYFFQKTAGHFHFDSVFERTLSLEGRRCGDAEGRGQVGEAEGWGSREWG